MKIGDQFTQGTYKTIYSLVSMGFTREVYVFNVSESKILFTFKGQVKDIENITEEEFLQITGSAKEYMDQWARLDGSPLFPEVTYTQGDIFEVKEATYESNIGLRLMLSQVGYGEMCLITVSGNDRGNRCSTPIKVGSSIAVTGEELRRMCGNTLQRIERV